jgi:hypothetical protein
MVGSTAMPRRWPPRRVVAIVVLAIVSATVACERAASRSVTARRIAPQDVEIVRLRSALQRLANALLPDPRVRGVAIGIEPGSDTEIPARFELVAFVSEEFPDEVDPTLPRFRRVVTCEFEGLPTYLDTEASGGFGDESGKTVPADRASPTGVSISHELVSKESGTIGCRLTDGKGGRWLLTNNHVIAVCGDAKSGYVLQPGRSTAGTKTDLVGRLQARVPLTRMGHNLVDAAIACTATQCLSTLTPLGQKPDESPVKVYEAMDVRKYGRQTGDRPGRLKYVHATLKLRLCSKGGFSFTDQLIVASPEGGPPFAEDGDSGSLVVSANPSSLGAPVGLLSAHDPCNGGMFVVNRIDHVLTELEKLGFPLKIDADRSEIGKSSQSACTEAIEKACKNVVVPITPAEEKEQDILRELDDQLARLRRLSGVDGARHEPGTRSINVWVSDPEADLPTAIRAKTEQFDVRRYPAPAPPDAKGGER